MIERNGMPEYFFGIIIFRLLDCFMISEFSDETQPQDTPPDNNNDDDYVVEEMDVFLTQPATESLFMFQYPNRPSWRRYNLNDLTRMTFYPEILHAVMTIPLSSELPMADDLDNDDSSKQFLELKGTPLSSLHGTNNVTYSVGRFIAGGDSSRSLYLAPLHGIMSFSPTVVGDRKVAAPKNPSDAASAAQQRVIANVSSLDQAHGTTLKYFDVGSKHGETLNKLFSPAAFLDKAEAAQSSLPSISMPVTPESYIARFASLSRADGSVRETDYRSFVEKVALKQDARRQIELIVKERHIVKFKAVRILATRAKDDQECLLLLSDYTKFVRGYFVINSEYVVSARLVPFRDYLLLLLATGTPGASSGKSLLHLRNVEDFCNQAFSRLCDSSNTYVLSRKRFTKETGLCADDILKLFSLDTMLVRNERTPGWSFKHQADLEFLQQFPEWTKFELEKWFTAAPLILSKIAEATRVGKLVAAQRKASTLDTLIDVQDLTAEKRDKLSTLYGVN